MTDGVHAAMHSMQPASLGTPQNPAPADAGTRKLPRRHQAVLARRDACDKKVRWCALVAHRTTKAHRLGILPALRRLPSSTHFPAFGGLGALR
jgi:hypothetical protein